MRYRIETDTLGEKQIPAEAYYGIGALRSKETCAITKHGIGRQMIKAFASIKKAAAKANSDIEMISSKVADGIALSCDEILNGRLHGQFITDLVQGGSGVSMNMNANEIIANRANELLGGEKGRYDFLSPETVNLNQDHKEIVLIAGKLSTIRLIKKMLTEAKKLLNSYYDKINQYGLSKTENASLGQELASFGEILDRDIKRITVALNGLYELKLTCSLDEKTADSFTKKFYKYLGQFTGENVYQTKNPFDSGRNLDCFSWISAALKSLCSNLSKVANDLYILASKDKVILPKVEALDVPVVIEIINQVSFYIMGNDLTISRAIEAGELENNYFLPIIIACLSESINMARRTMRTFREKAIEDLVLVGYEKVPVPDE